MAERVRVIKHLILVNGRVIECGSVWIVHRRYETTNGPRLALCDEMARVIVPCIKPEDVEELHD